jgi:hypothetical protein
MTVLRMPKHAQILNLIEVNGKLWLYAIFRDNPDDEIDRHFRLVALGEHIDQNHAHVSTIHCQGAVMHIFEALP